MEEIEKEKPKPTLASAVEENHKLITVLGVFTALTVFAANLRLQPFGQVLSFLFMSLTILVWFELWGRFPNERGNWTLTWFENLLFITVLAVVLYWLVDFRELWHTYLWLLVFSVILAVFSTVMKKFDVFNRLFRTQPGKLRFLRYGLGLVIVLGTLYCSIWISARITPSINLFLDVFNNTMQTPTP